MKTLIHLSVVLIGLGLASCSDDFTVEPDLKVTQVNAEIDFSGGNFNHMIDMNNDGTIDFHFVGFRGVLEDEPQLGVMTIIRLIPTVQLNQVASAPMNAFSACEMDIQYYPTVITRDDIEIGPQTNWSRESLLYAHMVTPSDCSHYIKHYESGTANTLCVRFQNNGYTFYGWIKVVPNDKTVEGCPELAENWRVVEYGYNPVPDQGFDLPTND